MADQTAQDPLVTPTNVPTLPWTVINFECSNNLATYILCSVSNLVNNRGNIDVIVPGVVYSDEIPHLNYYMQLLRHLKVGESGWRKALIVTAICSLTLSLATRFWAPCTSQSTVIKSVERRFAEPKRQHLDRDGTEWVAPVTMFSIVEPIVIEVALAPARPLLPARVFSDSLYNRPPPLSEFSL
jgi:hypothetical protein